MSYWYVEYLRAKGAIRIALILLGLFLLTAILLRAFGHGQTWYDSVVHSPTAHVTRAKLADGTTRIVVDDPARRTHAIILRHPDGFVDMDVTEPTRTKHHHTGIMVGTVNIQENDAHGTRHTVVHYREETPKYDLAILFLASTPMGLIVASLLGGLLAKENDGHLDVAWTKPVSRERYAIAGFIVDGAAIVLSQLLTIAVTLLATLMFFVPRFSYPGRLGWDILLAVAAPLAWYALFTAASASFKRGPGMVIGLGWAAAIIVPAVAQALQSAAPVSTAAAWFYAIFKGLSYLDPIAYLAFNHSSHRDFLLPLAAGAGVLCALTAGYLALALAQWRRVEA